MPVTGEVAIIRPEYLRRLQRVAAGISDGSSENQNLVSAIVSVLQARASAVSAGEMEQQLLACVEEI